MHTIDTLLLILYIYMNIVQSIIINIIVTQFTIQTILIK